MDRHLDCFQCGFVTSLVAMAILVWLLVLIGKRWDQFTLFLRDKSLPLPTTSPPLGNVRLQICQSNWVCNGISIPIFPITDEFECLWHIISLLGYTTSRHGDPILESLSLLSAGELLLILQHPAQMRLFG